MKLPNRISRRQLLRAGAASGVALSLPWLEYFVDPREARAAGGVGYTKDGMPKRLCVCYNGLGTLRNEWVTGTGTNYSFGALLQPLKSHQDRITVIKGLYQTGQGGAHPAAETGALTGSPLLGDIQVSNTAGGPSIDQRIADVVGAATPRRSISFAMIDGVKLISHVANGQPVTPYTNPYTAFNDILGGISAAPPGRVDVRAQALKEGRRRVLSETRARYALLKGRVGAADRLRLESHIAGLDALIQRLDFASMTPASAACAPSIGGQMGLPGMGGKFLEPRGVDAAGAQALRADGSFDAIVKTYMDMIVQAFTCQVTRIAVFNLGQFHSHANESHQAPPDQPGTAAYKGVLAAGVLSATRINYLVTALKSVPEGNGTLLDNTVILWIYSLADGDAHSRDDSRHVLIGNAGGTFKTGRLLEYDPKRKLQHNLLLTSVVNMFGIPDQRFGEPGWGDGPLTELGVTA